MSNSVSTVDTEDREKLEYVLKTFCDIPVSDIADSPVGRALAHNGIVGFNRDFLALTESDINGLNDPGDNATNAIPGLISPLIRRKLVMSLAFYHYASKLLKGPVNIKKMERFGFDNFRASVYNPNVDIKAWNYKEPIDVAHSTKTFWMKNTKPTRTDFKEFKDEAFWQRAKERIITTLQASGLEHIIDPTHKPLDPDLDDLQQRWFFKILQDSMTAPTAKTIVTNHLVDKNCRIGERVHIENTRNLVDYDDDSRCVIRDRIPVIGKEVTLPDNWKLFD